MAEVQPPDLSGAQGFKVYDPKIEDQERVEGSIYGGSRIFEYILIPEEGGELEIPSLRMAYFDPVAGAYQIARSKPIGIWSQARPEAEPTQSYGLTRKDILAVGQDIRHIKPDLQQLADRSYLHRSGWFWTAQGLMPLAYLGLLFYQRHQRRLEGDVAYARRRRARGAAGKRLDRARQLLADGRSPEFHAEVQGAVTAFLADQLNLAAAGLTAETCASALRERGAEEATVEAVLDLLGRCDLARFAPMASSRADMAQVQRESERIVAVLAGLS